MFTYGDDFDVLILKYNSYDVRFVKSCLHSLCCSVQSCLCSEMLPGVGVFGTENAARILVPILRESGFTIEALWGKTPADTEALATDLKIENFTTKIDEVLLRKNVDLVFVVCPPYLHSQISVKALGIGKHVIICSANVGLSQSDALKMCRASLYYPSLIALTSHTLRFLPGVVQMRKLIQDQQYLGDRGPALLEFRLQTGKLFHEHEYDWLCDETMGGGILNLFGSHLIDLVTFLTQQRAVRVNGVVRTFTETTAAIQGIRRVTAPDFCNFQLELTNGALVTVTLHSHQCINGPSTSFFSQDLMVCGRDGAYLALRGNDLYGQRSGTNGKEEVLYVDDSPYTTTEQLLPRPHVRGLCKMVAALREAFLPVHEQTGWIKSPVESAATFDDGLYVQAVLDAIRRSNEDRSWVPVTVISDSPTNQTKVLHAVRMSAAVAAD